MRALVEILKEDFPDTILDVSATPYNIYSVIVSADTDLSKFAGVLEDLLPEYFSGDEPISIYVSKIGEDRELLIEMNPSSNKVLKLELFIDGRSQVVTIVDMTGSDDTYAVLDENGKSFGTVCYENGWECESEILKPYVLKISEAIENR
ncbi:hypothetical protein OQX61_21385 [Pedobacter sp. PLR]|uniref:hypothetical protein n=1 Tax=Pedobacter sp. PLR TaxID=2994465 RepID=UPI0022470328|nr:hypothetical protein [Pedobacter sp. PLR]MCX2453836.1 hypothetical protein [Pedobacter sp. PLR]